MLQWKEEAWSFQQDMFRQLGDRAADDLNGNKVYLLDKLRYAFTVCYGENYLENVATKNLTTKIESVALNLFEKKEINGNFGCTFLNLRLKDESRASSIFGIFYLYKKDKTAGCVVDFYGRQYKSFPDFLKNNTLPKCDIIYPAEGLYCTKDNIKENFAELICDDSVACSTLSKVKHVCDAVSTVGSIATAGVLVCNPVSASILLGAAAVTIVTGAYTVGSGLNRLVDIHQHEGGLDNDVSKTALTFSEIAITAAGAVTVGAAAGIKGVATKTGRVLAQGTVASKLANNISKISRIYFGANAGINVAIIIKNCEIEGLSYENIERLIKIFFFSSFVIIPTDVLLRLIEHLRTNFMWEDIMNMYNKQPREIIDVVKKVCMCDSADNVSYIISYLFGKLFTISAEKISNLFDVCRRVKTVIELVLANIKNKELDFITLVKELALLWDDVKNYKLNYQYKILNTYGEDALKIVHDWTQNNVIDIKEYFSEYDNKVNAIAEIHQQVKNTIKICLGRKTNHYFNMELKLFSDILCLINLHAIRDSSYVINKSKFYCVTFQKLFDWEINTHHKKYFCDVSGNKENNKLTKESYFESKGIKNIYEHVFKYSLAILKTRIGLYHRQFETKFFNWNSINVNQGLKESKIYEFQMSEYDAPELYKKTLYEKAKELIPELTQKLNEKYTTFMKCENTAIIISNQYDFALFIHSAMENNNLHNMLYVGIENREN